MTLYDSPIDFVLSQALYHLNVRDGRINDRPNRIIEHLAAHAARGSIAARAA